MKRKATDDAAVATSNTITTATRMSDVPSDGVPSQQQLDGGVSYNNNYDPEPIRPEWLELPPELRSVDFTVDGAAAWDKYEPYNPQRSLPIVPVDTPPTFSSSSSSSSSALCFHINGIDGRARAATIHFPNNGPPVTTPRFMPVGTKGTLKGVLPDEIASMECPIILANTYHLAIQPGTELIDQVFGGLHNFMGGIRRDTDNNDNDNNDNNDNNKRLYNLLTDSGGFQMVSLAALSNVTEKGVVFQSPYSKEHMLLRPEDSIRCQNEIGADVIMQLDDVISSVATNEDRFRIATFRTLRWYDRCVQAHQYPHRQNLFPIVQGHLDTSRGGLRELCLAGFKHRDQHHRRIPGFAIGGLAGGESKDDFWKVVDHACRHLPDDRPRYLMGVGYPLDLVVCTALGVDMYDCVYPTRTARFGVALVDEGQIKLKQHQFAAKNPSSADMTINNNNSNNNNINSNTPIDKDCPCEACRRGVSKERLHSLLKANNPIGVQLVTQHNVTYMMQLVTRMRKSILERSFQQFVQEFLRRYFADDQGSVPTWVRDALQAAGLSWRWTP
ncbi:queuine tRNA-ribosyltransferase [Nitzschia inconspicua]|uniref:Queuine tRNA-ribosyltransferase n=1 Tax=Nitzschia inconspicua TaxID=303405 RepID=A0A9K3M4H9_9STRA|nr:queuine tRNA-ribosyltransferase [Nitzschia inconspicua]